MTDRARDALDRLDTDLVECLTIEVPGLDSMEGIGVALAGLVDAAAIRILDLVCMCRRADDARVEVLELADVESLSALEDVDGEVGGLLSQNDIEAASFALEPGSSAILVVVEDRWADTLSAAARQAGGRMVGGQRISASRIREALRILPPPGVDPRTREPEKG
jgi:hypothetical protein